ncbi:MAG TPA: TIM-barrel domain-containing protein [Rudaea sp.]|nr:TIM-barrel domain-containing protein [Rudaea sp.]
MPFYASAAWQSLGSIEKVETDADAVLLDTASGAKVQLSFPAAGVVRVHMAPTGALAPDHSYAIPGTVPRIPLHVEGGAGAADVVVASEGVRVVVRTRPNVGIAVYDADGALVVDDDPARPMAFDRDAGQIEVSKRRDPVELYYGFGEKALPMSRHQQYMTMWDSDTPAYLPGTDPIYQTIPFFIAVRGGKSYGVFFDNTYRSYFDMGKTDMSRYTFGANGSELDYYVFTGGRTRSPAAVLAEYTALTGRGPLPPLWALGYQQSRYSYTPQARVLEVARTFREKHIPADVIYLDIDYMDGFRIFTWSPQTFPQPDAMLHALHDEHFHAVTIVDPGIKVDPDFALYRAGRERGVFVRTALGDELHATVWPGTCAFPDFTSPKAREWFGSLYAGFVQQGVDGFWNDMNEPATFPPPNSGRPILVHDPAKTFPLDAVHDGDGAPGTHARYHNVFGMQMARATFEGLAKLSPERRPFVLTRAGFAGVQRYSAVWTGDNVASWTHLALSIPMLTNLSISGVPFVGADVGGFAGAPTADLYTRWLQAAALTPFFRTHAEINTPDREPWSYGDAHERMNRAAIELRYRVLPYLYTLFADEETGGEPPLRPLWFDHVDDVETYLVEDEFMLGDALLAAPVVRAGDVKRKVYFPRGSAWFDWWDGTRHEGGTRVDVDAPLERLPLFVRAGAALPTAPVVQYSGELAHTPLILAVALGADGGGHIYEDAGDGYAYRHGASRTIRIALHGDALHIDAPPSRGFPEIGAVEVLGLDAAPASVRVDGKSVAGFRYDAATRRLHVDLPAGARDVVLKR